jgi:hypothetical protein
MNIPKVFIKYSSHLAQNRMINVNNIISISTETDLGKMSLQYVLAQ